MAVKKDAPKHSLRHTVYKNEAGKRIVSSTGALNILAKPALIYWAWDLGMSGIDYKKYTVLGACNPPLAHKALQADEEVGLFLPCNIAVYEKDGKTTISVFDPLFITTVIDNPQIKSVAEEVKKKLARVLETV